MSKSIIYSDSIFFNRNEGAHSRSILIKQLAKDSLFESTYFVNVTEKHRNPILSIIYDSHYNIISMKKGAVFINYEKQ